MFPNAKGSELFSVLATIDPASQAVGTVTTGWISAGNHHSLLALVQSGVLGTGATLDAKLQQATRVARGSGREAVPDYLQTHPVTTTRISEARQRADQLRGDQVTAVTTVPGGERVERFDRTGIVRTALATLGINSDSGRLPARPKA